MNPNHKRKIQIVIKIICYCDSYYAQTHSLLFTVMFFVNFIYYIVDI